MVNLDFIIDQLKKENPVIIPTDTIYGFSSLISSKKAHEKIVELKRRENKPFIVLDSNIERVKNYFSQSVVDSGIIDKLSKYVWPNGLTLVGEKNPRRDFTFLNGYNTIAVRFTDHYIIKSLTDYFNDGLLSTSVNISGEEELLEYNSIHKKWCKKVSGILKGKTGSYRSSVILSFKDSGLEIVREGPLDIMIKLRRVLNV
ncbi:MAG: hypothetical protein CR982_02100 [Candidatus Cloacimonadota bacterium]|nr:MAG: hypothetical protein CR982_02100 [Candidatus Cloacimonadota bacterium]PIE80820.1 MAG: hypothetical protein CSA15_01430 [Candidatus Delongbacteria bacterium]